MTTIGRARAVSELADVLDGPDVIVAVPPDAVRGLASALHGTSGWHAYVDGRALVERVDNAVELRRACSMWSSHVLAVVPCGAPAEHVAAELGIRVAGDVAMTATPGDPVRWPWLLLAALAIVDPDTAAEIRRTGRAVGDEVLVHTGAES